MTKGDLIAAMAKAAGISKRAAEDALNGALSSITKALKKGDSVTLVGFGSFKVVKRAARAGVNPQTSEKIKIPARKAPVFRAGKGLKDAVK
jgi:DNA-binding protein HU-beta